MANNYFPALSTLISEDQIPENLTFLTNGLASLLENVHFKDLQVQRSFDNATIAYKLDIVSFSEILRLEIPGTGLVLTLNPDLDDPNVDFSVIPVTLTWHWGIQQYFRDFNVQNFSFTPQAFFDLVKKIFSLEEETMLLSITDGFINDPSPLSKFAIDANAKYPSLNIPIPLNSNQDLAINQILTAIDQYSGPSLFEIILSDYVIDGNNSDVSLQNLNRLLFPAVGTDAVSNIKELFVPRITASIELSAGLEIPRSVLVPIKANGELEEDENVKTVLIFEIGELVYDTKGGFGFQDEMSLSFPASHPKAQIGKTGINIGFTKAKLDLSKLTNIPEADAAGYPTDFVGLYIQDAVIEFTRFGDEDPNRTSVALSGQDLLIGTGGLTGAIILETGGLLYRKFGNFEVGLDVFSLTFQQNSIAGSFISGTLTIPRFQNNDASAQINIQASIFDNGNFKITAKPFAQPYPITLPNVFTLEVVSLEIGNEARGH